MRPQRRLQGQVLLALVLLLGGLGCAVEQGKVYVKDGQRYGVIAGQTWRGRWWNYYERGTSYAAGAFWDEAVADFQEAITQRPDDQRRARTYGLHFTDYFPRRELGIVFYRLNRHPEAIHELEASLGSEETAKAKFYLNKARKSLLEQTGGDTAPPRIRLDGPPDSLLTNRLSITVTGHAESTSYIAALAINGRSLFIELAEPRLTFTEDVALQDGTNTIDIVAVDLLGRSAHRRIAVELDRHGPLVSLDSVALHGQPPQQQARVQGAVLDRSRLMRFLLAGRNVPLPAAREATFHEEVPVVAGMTALPFEAEDAAGNVTRGEIALASTTPGSPRTREGKPANDLLPRWAFLPPGAMISDIAGAPSSGPAIVQRPDLDQLVIRLAGLADQETVYDEALYLEGNVTSATAIYAFSVNGESLWRRKCKQLFFGHIAALQEGRNRFHLEAADEAGNTATRDFVVTREMQKARQMGSRLRVTLMPFEKKGTPSVLAETVYAGLFGAFLGQRRFNFVDRQELEAILQELKLSQTDLVDPATAARVGKIAGAEGVLIGSVSETPSALDVYTRFVDVETSMVLAAADVYGEDLNLWTLKTLMEGLTLKWRRHFPLSEGVIIEKAGKKVLTDLSHSHRIQQAMRLIIFREGKEVKHPVTGRMLRPPAKVIGEARITAVSDDLSEAIVQRVEPSEDVRELDKVITK